MKTKTKKMETAKMETVATITAVAIPAPGEIASVTKKLTRDEWRALSPEQKRARKEAMKAKRASIKTRVAQTLTRMARRSRRLAAMLDGDASATLRQITALLSEVEEAVIALPNDWKPKSASGASATVKFTVGDVVQIAASKQAQYEGLLDEGEMLNLKIVKVVGKRVVVTTENGTRMFLPTNNVKKAD